MATLPPLSHDEIISLVEPFTRRGYRVDLAATDRIERRLVFKPIEHAGATPASAGLREDLECANPYAKVFCLTRLLTPKSGPPAILVAEGGHPGELLDLLSSITPDRQFVFSDELLVSHRHRIEPAVDGAEQLLLTESVAQVGGLTLTLRMPMARRRPAEIEIQAAAGDPIVLPEDLLAVLGWDWSPLKRAEAGLWKSRLRLRGAGPRQSRCAETRLERTARHLARTLAEPPPRFHERFVAARWWAAVRRTIPILTAVLLTTVAVLLPAEYVKARPALAVLLMNLPLLLIGLSLTLQEQARIEIAPLPRPSPANAWRPPRED